MVDFWKVVRRFKALVAAGMLPVTFIALGCCAITAAAVFRPGALSGAGLAPAQDGAVAERSARNDAWAPALLYDIISSPSSAALDSLYDAAFATGPALVPQLVLALKDDRTAEFAAQSLAFIGGEASFTALSKLVGDPRNLNLRRFYYGALGEIDTPQAEFYLVHVVRAANDEPDRTVTEAAILALTVRTDANLLPRLKQAKTGLTDPVVVDEVDNAISVIQTRAQYLQTHKNPGGSLREALDLYFEPAFEEPTDAAPAAGGNHGAAAPPSQAQTPGAKVEVQHVELSPDRSRALARVLFTEQGESEHYRMVLQKRYGDWTVASVWLSLEEEGVPTEINAAPGVRTSPVRPPTPKK